MTVRSVAPYRQLCPLNSSIQGLYVIADMYPFHLQARQLNVWTMGFIISPFLSPFAFGFFVARARCVCEFVLSDDELTARPAGDGHMELEQFMVLLL